MSDDTDFDMTLWSPETGWGRPPVPGSTWGRPPTGAWPPCPPSPRPPGPGWPPPGLDQCYDMVQQAQAFLKKVIADMVEADPDVFGIRQPTLGVTDGSNAPPGMVGEFVRLWAPDLTFPTATFTQTAVAGILPAGDFAVQAYAYVNGAVTGAQFYLDPTPPGLSDSMGAVLALSGQENITLVGPLVRASLSQPEVLSFSCTTNNEGPGPAPGTMSVRVNAWRMR